MIRNDRQLQIAQKKLSELVEAAGKASGDDKKVWQSLVAEVRCEIDEYQQVSSGVVSRFEIHSMDDLPDALIKARIAQKLTQSELASRLHVSEQMVQKDEAGGYENAGLARLADTCDVLNYELVGHLQPVQSAHMLFANVTPVTTLSPNSSNVVLHVSSTLRPAGSGFYQVPSASHVFLKGEKK